MTILMFHLICCALLLTIAALEFDDAEAAERAEPAKGEKLELSTLRSGRASTQAARQRSREFDAR